jgi:NhaP-type Na+/H+ or K+/H+ antiporter
MYIPFNLAEFINLSGIVTIFFAGMSARRYIEPNVPEDTTQNAAAVFKVASYLAETCIFLELGLSGNWLLLLSLLLFWDAKQVSILYLSSSTSLYKTLLTIPCWMWTTTYLLEVDLLPVQRHQFLLVAFGFDVGREGHQQSARTRKSQQTLCTYYGSLG